MKKSSTDRPYEILARETKARMVRLGLTPSCLETKTKLGKSLVKALCAGMRGVPPSSLRLLAKALLRSDEDVDVLHSRLQKINAPGASITHLLRGLDAELNIGYLESPPFAYASRRGPDYPEGLLVDLMESFFQLIGVNWKWRCIPFDKLVDSLENREVDLITGFILESPSRQTRALFIPLEMPFAIGVNAMTRSAEVQDKSDYSEFHQIVAKAKRSPDKKLNIITVRREIADEYFSALFPGIELAIRDEKRSLSEAIIYYLNVDPQKSRNILFCDHMSCVCQLPPGAKVALKRAVGRFKGGFLLPMHDDAWKQYFQGAFRLFMKARLPRVGKIFTDRNLDLIDFIEVSDRVLSLSQATTAKDKSRHEQDFWTLEEWLEDYWPIEIPVPQSFMQHIRHAAGAPL